MSAGCKSMRFDVNGPPAPLPDEPLSPQALREIGFERVKTSSEVDSWGSKALQVSFFGRPSFREIMAQVLQREYHRGYQEAQREMREALGL